MFEQEELFEQCAIRNSDLKRGSKFVEVVSRVGERSVD